MNVIPHLKALRCRKCIDVMVNYDSFKPHCLYLIFLYYYQSLFNIQKHKGWKKKESGSTFYCCCFFFCSFVCLFFLVSLSFSSAAFFALIFPFRGVWPRISLEVEDVHGVVSKIQDGRHGVEIVDGVDDSFGLLGGCYSFRSRFQLALLRLGQLLSLTLPCWQKYFHCGFIMSCYKSYYTMCNNSSYIKLIQLIKREQKLKKIRKNMDICIV